MINPAFSYYSNSIKASETAGWMRLTDLHRAVVRPNPKMAEIFKRIEEAAEAKDEAAKLEWKSKCYSCTPAVYCYPRRRYDNIVNFTGLIPLDFDKLPSRTYAEYFRDRIFNENPQVIMSWLSSSKKGVRCLFNIPRVQTVDEFKMYFQGLKARFGRFTGFDMAPQNAVLPLFISHDPEAKFRDNFETWIEKVIPEPKPTEPDAAKVQAFKIKHQYGIDINEDKAKAFNNLTKAIAKIYDNGHPQLRAAAVAAAGYVKAGYFAEYEAEIP